MIAVLPSRHEISAKAQMSTESTLTISDNTRLSEEELILFEKLKTREIEGVHMEFVWYECRESRGKVNKDYT